MSPEHSYWILVVSTAAEILLMALAIVFYLKLRKSELLKPVAGIRAFLTQTEKRSD